MTESDEERRKRIAASLDEPFVDHARTGAREARRVEAERPDKIEPGQHWGLWVYDDALYERITIQAVNDDTAAGITEDGNLCAISIRRLLERGDYLGGFREGDLKNDLRRVFAKHGVTVAVGHKPGGGIVISSQDERVDARNMNETAAQEDPDGR